MLLRRSNAATLMVLRDKRVSSLSEKQLLEVLKFQSGENVNPNFLVANDKDPFFWMSNGFVKRKEWIVEYVERPPQKGTKWQ